MFEGEDDCRVKAILIRTHVGHHGPDAGQRSVVRALLLQKPPVLSFLAEDQCLNQKF